MALVRHLPEPWKSRIIRASFETLRALRLRELPRSGDTGPCAPGDLVVSGFAREPLGIGRGARLALSALEAAGFKPTSHDIRPALNAYPRGRSDLPGKDGVWLVVANPPEAEVLLQGFRFSSWRRRYRIAHWAWETTEPPRDWARTAIAFHEIWVQSRFVAEAFIRCFAAAGRPDLSARLRLTPPLLSVLETAPDRQAFELPCDAMIALASFDPRSGLARKNPTGALEAWLKAFPEPRRDAFLLIKMLGDAPPSAAHSPLLAKMEARPDVRLMRGVLSAEAMDRLFASIDLFVSLHRAEGFGLPLAEALAAGKPVLATDYSAPSEFLDPSCALLVPAREVAVTDPEGQYSTGAWGEPDLEAAARALMWAAENRDALAQLGAQGRARITELGAFWRPDALRAAPFARHVR